MMNRSKVKLAVTAAVVSLWSLLMVPATAEACPLCQDQLSQQQSLAFSVSALFMLSMPFMLVGLIGLMFVQAFNPQGYAQLRRRIASFVRPKWAYIVLSLVAVPLLFYAFSPADPTARPNRLPRDQLVGQPNLMGRPIGLAHFDNKVVLVNFFASWCDPCKAEVAALGDLYREYREREPGLEVIGVTFDFEHQDEPAAQPHVHPDGIIHYHALPNTLQILLTFLQVNHAAYSVIPNAPAIAESFGEIRAIPTTFLFNRQGLLSKKYVGPPAMVTLKADVQALLTR